MGGMLAIVWIYIRAIQKSSLEAIQAHGNNRDIYYSGEKRKNNIWAGSLGGIIGLGVVVTI